MRGEAGGAVFLHPVCSNLSRAAKADEEWREPLGCSSLRQQQQRAAQKTPITGGVFCCEKRQAVPRLSGFPTAKVSLRCLLAKQHLVAGFWFLANVFAANGANFLVALGPAVT